MGFDQYHEPPGELSKETRTFARMITSLIEEAEAIGWYEQRVSVETDKEAQAIMKSAQKEEFKHFGMDLEFLLRRKPIWRAELKESSSQKVTLSNEVKPVRKKPINLWRLNDCVCRALTLTQINPTISTSIYIVKV